MENPEPPLSLEKVRNVLRLDLKYYSSTDVSPLHEFAHRIRLAGKLFIADPMRILEVVKKAKLSGLWIPDNRKIYIDEEQPQPKHRWIEAHEILHSVIPWHAEFLLGDNEMTLDPDFHESLESEANFGAGQLIFLGERFGREALDYPRNFESIRALKDIYRNSMMSTLWRFVEERDPQEAAFGLVSRHPLHPGIGGGPNGEPVYKFVASAGFRQRFPSVTADQIYSTLKRHSKWSRRGPVVNGSEQFDDAGASKRLFHLDGFCNSHQVLTYGYQVT